jgi:hypothetical protein|tara:strand:+ start:328 stop:693 length:366 start_codon:yes stop_codon:yes gene_type:complete
MLLFIALAVCVAFLVAANARRGRNHYIDKLIRQSARYATAAQQDGSPLVATLHANYAAGYLYALKDIATNAEIHDATGIDVKKFNQHILAVQDMVTKKTVEACPSFRGQVDLYLSTIGGEG